MTQRADDDSGRPGGSARPGRARRAGGRVHRAASATASGTGRVVGATGRRIRRATSAEGAGETGLAKLIELQAVSSAGDMMITLALASTIFFSVPTGEARGRVALYLLITMAPFVLLAPLIGPLLDRIPSGRRAAMAVTMLARAALAWMMAGSMGSGSIQIYPEALGVLVASKANGVVRSVVVPRLLPPRLPAVKANARVTLAGLIATGLAAAVGGGLHLIGPDWPLRGAFLLFVVAAGLAFALPPQVDQAHGEQRAKLSDAPTARQTAAAGGGVSLEKHPAPAPAPGQGPGPQPGPEPATPTPAAQANAAQANTAQANTAQANAAPPHKAVLRSVGPSVVLALRAQGTLRGLFGFLTFFLAFLVRAHPVNGLRPTIELSLVAGGLGIGNTLGTVLGSWLRSRRPETIVTAMLVLATAAAVGATVVYGLPTLTLLAGVSGLTQSLGKVSLDSLIQRDVPEAVRTSAFARSETLMQLMWVGGGGLGIVLPLVGRVGTATAAGLLLVSLAWTARSLWRLRAPRRHRTAVATPDVA